MDIAIISKLSHIFLLLLFITFIILCYKIRKIFVASKKTFSPICWPIIGMLTTIINNFHRPHDHITEVLQECGGKFMFKGPYLWNIDMAFTCDPSDIHHILSKNFANYSKGPKFKKMFDILGDGIFNVDAKLWEIHRKIIMTLVNHVNFRTTFEQKIIVKLEGGMIPVLDNFCQNGMCFDLQDMFKRFTFDNFCQMLLDYDPCSMSILLPEIPYQKAMDNVMEAILYRHAVAESCWKYLKWIGIGTEKFLSKSIWMDIDNQFIYPCIRSKIRKRNTRNTNSRPNDFDFDFDFLADLMDAYQEEQLCYGTPESQFDIEIVIRDMVMNLFFAGRDTTSITLSWFFWLLTKNPSVEAKIKEEIDTVLLMNNNNIGESRNNYGYIFNMEESSKLVYLYGALKEALRLFPPLPWQHKYSLKSDVLPSGLIIEANTKVILSFYAMGRMESIWGKDCLEFKPERWISENTGKIKHEPSFKFPAFNAGPRTCIGKEIAFIQMKMVAATIIHNYQIQIVEDHHHPIIPSSSIMLQMKYGFPIKISKRV